MKAADYKSIVGVIPKEELAGLGAFQHAAAHIDNHGSTVFVLIRPI